MDNTLCVSHDTLFDNEIFGKENTGTYITYNTYVTEPMPVIKKPVYQLPDEEELHTSFEEAISGRLLAMHSRLSHLSASTQAIKNTECSTDAVLLTTTSIRNATQPAHITSPNYPENISRHVWKRTTIFACSATMFLLLGFDLMGFLVLHMH